MTENLAHILVFKTNINTDADKLRVKYLLSGLTTIEEWSVDLEDIDRVLRVVSYEASTEEIIFKLGTLGFECQELE